MSEITVRYGDAKEISTEVFGLYDADNEGEDIIIAESDGQIVGYAQATGNMIFFLESNYKGAGRAIVEWMESRTDELIADNVTGVSKGFWTRMGFESRGRNQYVWYAD